MKMPEQQRERRLEQERHDDEDHRQPHRLKVTGSVSTEVQLVRPAQLGVPSRPSS